MTEKFTKEVGAVDKSYLGDRTKYLGASDYPALLGVSRFKSYDMLVAEKKGLIKNEIADRFYVDRGDAYEEDVIGRYEVDNKVQVLSQYTVENPELKNTAHLDGLIKGQNGAPDTLIEVKSKTIPKEYIKDLDGFIQSLENEPPIEYLAQMVDQYHLCVQYGGLKIDKCLLIIGLFKNRSTKVEAEMYIDVTEQVKKWAEQLTFFGNMFEVDSRIGKFWKDVANKDYKFNVKTELEIKRYQMKLELEEKGQGFDVEADKEDRELINEYKKKVIELTISQDKTKELKSEIESIEKKLIEKYPDARSVGDDFNKLIIETKLDAGRYTEAKGEAVVQPKFKKLVKIG